MVLVVEADVEEEEVAPAVVGEGVRCAAVRVDGHGLVALPEVALQLTRVGGVCALQ